MKRIALWFLTTLSAIVVLFGYHTSTSGALASSAAPAFSSSSSTGSASSGTTGGSPSSSGSGSAGTAPPASSSSSAGSGSGSSSTATGEVAQTRWGPIQVQLVISGKTITGVNVLQYPNGNGKDVEINNYALPVLIKETTDQQSASIDMVSGATVTSDGYLQSLQSALDKAGL